MASSITITVNQPYPTQNNAITTPGGGSWSAGTYSFMVAAWDTASETDVDNAGVPRSTQALWNNIAVAENDEVVIDWTAADRVPHHYSVYFQSGASYNLAASGTKIAQVAGNLLTATILDEASIGTAQTFGAAATTMTLVPVIDFRPVVRKKTARGYNGKLVKLNLANSTLCEFVDIVLSAVSATHAQGVLLAKFCDNATRVTVEDDSDTGGSTDPYISSFVGRLVEPDFLQSTDKRSDPYFRLRLEVESEVLAT